jgi:hypothetical protein
MSERMSGEDYAPLPERPRMFKYQAIVQIAKTPLVVEFESAYTDLLELETLAKATVTRDAEIHITRKK